MGLAPVGAVVVCPQTAPHRQCHLNPWGTPPAPSSVLSSFLLAAPGRADREGRILHWAFFLQYCCSRANENWICVPYCTSLSLTAPRGGCPGWCRRCLPPWQEGDGVCPREEAPEICPSTADLQYRPWENHFTALHRCFHFPYFLILFMVQMPQGTQDLSPCLCLSVPHATVPRALPSWEVTQNATTACDECSPPLSP